MFTFSEEMESNQQIQITDEALRRAASEGMDAFLRVFTDAYYQALGGALTAESMPRLNAAQHTLLAYTILRDELMEGGFCQLIQNGWARKVYDAHREDLERERTDEEFMAMYEQYEAFDDLEDSFLENEEEWTAQVAHYVDEHLGQFAEIVN